MSSVCNICGKPIEGSYINYNGSDLHWDCYDKKYVWRPYFRERNYKYGEYVIRRLNKRKYNYYLQMADGGYFAYSGYKCMLFKQHPNPFVRPEQVKGFYNVDQALIYWGLNIKKDKRFIKLAKTWNENIKKDKEDGTKGY